MWTVYVIHTDDTAKDRKETGRPLRCQSYPQAIKFDFDYILGLNIVQRVSELI